jgi:hypothetical protein
MAPCVRASVRATTRAEATWVIGAGTVELRDLIGQRVTLCAIRCRCGGRGCELSVSGGRTPCLIGGTRGSLRPCPLIPMPTCRPNVPRPSRLGSTRRSVIAVSAESRSTRLIPAVLIRACPRMRRRSCISAARLPRSKSWSFSARRPLHARRARRARARLSTLSGSRASRPHRPSSIAQRPRSPSAGCGSARRSRLSRLARCPGSV